MTNNKRIPELINDNPGFVPDAADGLVVYDSSANITKGTIISSLIPSGINGLLFKNLSSNATGTNALGVQPWFPSLGSVTVEASKTYVFEGYLRISRSAGTTSHTTSLAFGGTATVSSIAWSAVTNTGDTVASNTPSQVSAEVATATAIKAASTSATEQIAVYIKGTVRFSAIGTFIPQFSYSAAPGGAPSILANSNFTMYPIGSNTVVSSGVWS
jgi:hypothetical protein